MTRRTPTIFALLLLAATAAGAGTFTVTLTNGTTFESRYRPVEAEWDDGIVLITTDRGNPIALLKEEVADVTSSVEVSGFGYQLDTTTIFLGWSPNEEPPEEEEAKAGPLVFQPEPGYTVQQFVDPGNTGNIPLSSPFGGAIVVTPPQQ